MDFDWLLVAASFAIGTFPTALIVGRAKGTNPLMQGSGNPGATNMFRIAGKRAGLMTLSLDVTKALAATLAGRAAGGSTLGAICGAAATLGHIYPLYRSSGGKGVACFCGLTVGAWPVIAPFGGVAWLIGALVTGRAFVGALLACPAVALGTIVASRPALEVATVWALTAIIAMRHRPNISNWLADRRDNGKD